jgi:xanthine dehydrogenase YagS FAD-binding subunit
MRNFAYHRPASLDAARDAAARAGAMVLAGGTTLLDLAKCGVAQPETVVDITHLRGLDAIAFDETGVTIGALARMSTVAADRGIRERYPAISEALWQAASAQLRNMATIGGNLLQRTRCPCGCAAIGGATRNHAVLGTSEACIATNPGDLAVALVALGAEILIGERRVAAEDFFLLPGDTPHREHAIEAGEIITGIRVPASAVARRSTYLKVRDRQSYEFAAASAAVGMELEADGRTIRDIRVTLGGVATKPWRARAVEAALKGQALSHALIDRAAALATEGAVVHGDNGHKVHLAPRVVARAIINLKLRGAAA